jgi:fructuronate reductase/mannitol 2-dehydrogenase
VSAYLLPLLTLAVAGWFRYPRAVDLDGAPITVVDARADRLQSLAQAGGDDPRPLLTVRELFGDLGDTRRFVATLEYMLGSIDRDGLQATLHAFLPEQS